MNDIFYILHREKPMSIEFPPIRRWDDLETAINLFREFRLDRYFKLCNLPQNTLGIPSSDTALPAYYIAKELGIHTINHLPYRTENLTTYIGKLIEYSLADVEGILLISGDIKTSDITFKEAAKLVKSFGYGYIDLDGKKIWVRKWRFALGAALIPNRDGEANIMLSKMEAGSEFFQTQITLDDKPLINLLEDIADRIEDDIPILVGIIPYKESIENVISKILGMRTRDILMLDMERYIDHLEDILKKILDLSNRIGSVNIGIHIYPIRWRRESIEYTVKLISRF